ncbi:redoxin domain-containing protein [Mucilaginibacter sp. HD30]
MKNLIIACLLACTVPTFAQKKQFEIAGNVNNSSIRTIYLSYQSKKQVDSTAVVDHKFRFTGDIEDVELVALQVGNMRYPTALESGVLNFSFINDSMEDVLVTGQQPAVDFKDCFLLMLSFQKQIMVIRSKHAEAAARRDTAAMIAAGKENDQVNIDRVSVTKRFAEAHLSSLIIPYIIKTDLKSLPIIEIEDLYKKLSLAVRNSKGGTELTKFINAKRAVKIGQTAPAFSQKTHLGKAFSLNDLKGNYILLNFWASWCAPCRLESPALVNIHENLKQKNFKMISVSLDEYKNSWLKAIKEDHLAGYHLSDLKGWKNGIAVEYGVGALPITYLLDPQLKIIAINPDLASLENTLNGLFK